MIHPAITIAVLYALVRAKHDSYLSHGKWKPWAFAEGILVAIVVALGYFFSYDIAWWNAILVALVFGLSFWIVFDCTSGWLRARNIFYLGSFGWDLKAKRIFISGKKYFLFKLIWLAIAIGFYLG